MMLFVITRRLGRRLYSIFFEATFTIGLFSWDIALSLYNLFTPKLKEGAVIPPGHIGHGGKWPEYQPPKPGDSRCSCPALNALANHGTPFVIYVYNVVQLKLRCLYYRDFAA